jgi:hypothetical protein
MISTEWPLGDIILKNKGLASVKKIELLGSSKPVKFRKSGNGLVISPPVLTPDDYQPAYVFKINSL